MKKFVYFLFSVICINFNPIQSLDSCKLIHNLNQIEKHLLAVSQFDGFDFSELIDEIAFDLDRQYLQAKQLKFQHIILKSQNYNENPPFISFVIPCYNRRRCIFDSINSIYKQDLQYPFEVIVVDDCSTDGSYEVLLKSQAKFKNLRVLKNNKNRKAPYSRNIGFINARGAYVFNLDSDDVLSPNSLNTFISHVLQNNLKFGLFETLMMFKDTKIKDLTPIHQPPSTPFLDIHSIIGEGPMTFCAGNRLINQEAFLNCGGYLDNFGQDSWTMTFRMMSRGYLADVVPGSFYFHRVWSNGASMWPIEEKNNRNTVSPILALLEKSELFENIEERLPYMTMNLFSTCFMNNPKDIFGLKLFDSSTLNAYFNACQAEDQQLYDKAISYYLEAIAKGMSHPRVYFRILVNALYSADFSMAYFAIDHLKSCSYEIIIKEDTLASLALTKSSINYFML